jgi:hypothetical protein
VVLGVAGRDRLMVAKGRAAQLDACHGQRPTPGSAVGNAAVANGGSIAGKRSQ